MSGREAIRANVEMALEKLGPLADVPFGLDRQSVVWVEGFIERQQLREDFDPDHLGAMPEVLGCFLGEAVALHAGGEWECDEEYDSWSVRLANGSSLFPLTKVRKRLEGGPEDSIVSFFDIAVDYIATGRFDDARNQSRPD